MSSNWQKLDISPGEKETLEKVFVMTIPGWNCMSYGMDFCFGGSSVTMELLVRVQSGLSVIDVKRTFQLLPNWGPLAKVLPPIFYHYNPQTSFVVTQRRAAQLPWFWFIG